MNGPIIFCTRTSHRLDEYLPVCVPVTCRLCDVHDISASAPPAPVTASSAPSESRHRGTRPVLLTRHPHGDLPVRTNTTMSPTASVPSGHQTPAHTSVAASPPSAFAAACPSLPFPHSDPARPRHLLSNSRGVSASSLCLKHAFPVLPLQSAASLVSPLNRSLSCAHEAHVPAAAHSPRGLSPGVVCVRLSQHHDLPALPTSTPASLGQELLDMTRRALGPVQSQGLLSRGAERLCWYFVSPEPKAEQELKRENVFKRSHVPEERSDGSAGGSQPTSRSARVRPPAAQVCGSEKSTWSHTSRAHRSVPRAHHCSCHHGIY